MYNYLDAMIEDISFVRNDYDWDEIEDKDELREKMYDDLWNDDSVTGNASGSYTFNRTKAREFVMDNMDLCITAVEEFCTPPAAVGEKFLDQDWEWFDVTIRCYLLSQAIDVYLKENE